MCESLLPKSAYTDTTCMRITEKICKKCCLIQMLYSSSSCWIYKMLFSGHLCNSKNTCYLRGSLKKCGIFHTLQWGGVSGISTLKKKFELTKIFVFVFSPFSETEESSYSSTVHFQSSLQHWSRPKSGIFFITLGSDSPLKFQAHCSKCLPYCTK